MKLRVAIIAGLFVIAMTVVAVAGGLAGWSNPLQQDHSGSQSPMPTPSPTVVTVKAPIDDVRIEYFSDGSYLVVTSGLPNGCTTFKGYSVTYEDGVINVTVENTTLEGPDVFCTMIYGIVETRIPLSEVEGPGDIAPCKTYPVEVNGTLYQLQAIGENIRCAAPDNGGHVIGGAGHTLGYGDTIVAEGTGLTVTFKDVLEDSRCPATALCIWEGQARVLLSVALHKMAPQDYELALRGDSGMDSVDVHGYALKLHSLDPYPQQDAPEKSEYQITISVHQDCEKYIKSL